MIWDKNKSVVLRAVTTQIVVLVVKTKTKMKLRAG